jgi:hypothetical protein
MSERKSGRVRKLSVKAGEMEARKAAKTVTPAAPTTVPSLVDSTSMSTTGAAPTATTSVTVSSPTPQMSIVR